MPLPDKPDYYDTALSFSLTPVSDSPPELLVEYLTLTVSSNVPFSSLAVITTDGSNFIKSPSSKWPTRPIGTKHLSCCVTMFFSFIFSFPNHSHILPQYHSRIV